MPQSRLARRRAGQGLCRGGGEVRNLAQPARRPPGKSSSSSPPAPHGSSRAPSWPTRLAPPWRRCSVHPARDRPHGGDQQCSDEQSAGVAQVGKASARWTRSRSRMRRWWRKARHGGQPQNAGTAAGSGRVDLPAGRPGGAAFLNPAAVAADGAGAQSGTRDSGAPRPPGCPARAAPVSPAHKQASAGAGRLGVVLINGPLRAAGGRGRRHAGSARSRRAQVPGPVQVLIFSSAVPAQAAPGYRHPHCHDCKPYSVEPHSSWMPPSSISTAPWSTPWATSPKPSTACWRTCNCRPSPRRP